MLSFATLVHITLLALSLPSAYGGTIKSRLTIGAIFDRENSQSQLALKHSLKWYNSASDDTLYVIDWKIIPGTNLYNTGESVCNMTKTGAGVVAIFGPQDPLVGAITQSVCEKLTIPYIQTTWQPETNAFPSVSVNFYPAADLLAKGFAEIVQNMGWKRFAIVYQQDEALLRLQGVLEKIDIAQTSIIRKLGPGSDYRSLFENLREAHVTNIILDCKPKDTIDILHQAKDKGLLTSSISYLLTSLNSHTIDFSWLLPEANITVVRLFDPLDVNLKTHLENWYEDATRTVTPTNIQVETVLTLEAVNLFVRAVGKLQNVDQVEQRPTECGTSDVSENSRIADYIKVLQHRDSFTGSIEFDNFGRRINFTLQVVEQGNEKAKAIWTPMRGITFFNHESHNLCIKDSLQVGKTIDC